MHADDLFHGDGEKAIGIVVAQIILGSEGQVFQITQAADVFRLDPSLIHLLSVWAHLVIDSRYQCL